MTAARPKCPGRTITLSPGGPAPPSPERSAAAGLQVDNGVVVDELLRTSDHDIYAAGDVAAYLDAALGLRRRVEHEDNANSMGKAAGRSMAMSASSTAGAPQPYNHLPFFYSDMFDLGYEAVGEVDSGMETVVDWKEPYREGVIYYLQDGKVRGVLLWNVWGQLEAARRLILQSGPFTPEDLSRRLPASLEAASA